MIRVTIDVNGHVIHTTHAVRQEQFKGADQNHLYKNDMGDLIIHKFNKGGIKLAIELLEILEERKQNGRVPETEVEESKED